MRFIVGDTAWADLTTIISLYLYLVVELQRDDTVIY